MFCHSCQCPSNDNFSNPQDGETAQPATKTAKKSAAASSSSDGESGSKDSSSQPGNATADDNMSEASVAILHSDHDKNPRCVQTQIRGGRVEY